MRTTGLHSIGAAFRRATTAMVVVSAALCAISLVGAAGPDVRFITVTDLTPRSFRIVWISSDPAQGTLRLFEAPGCVNEIFNAPITPFPTVTGDASIVNHAQQLGVVSVQVEDLQPDTEYCVQTVTTSNFSSLSTTAPDPLLIVRTEKRTTRARAPSPSDPNLIGFSNDLAKLEITRSVPGADTRGALILVKVEGASTPLSAFVGDGIDDDGDATTHTALALVNLNNLYGAASHESLDLAGDGTEEISARVLGSPEGFVTVQAHLVPADANLSELKAPAPCAGAGQTACEGRLGDGNADGSITALDAEIVRDLVVGLTPILPCMVCGDVTWDFSDDMKDALAIAQFVAALRVLPW